jgi:hypothetical protein
MDSGVPSLLAPSRPAAKCRARPATPPRSAAPPASSPSPQPRYRRASNTPPCTPRYSPRTGPDWEWVHLRAVAPGTGQARNGAPIWPRQVRRARYGWRLAARGPRWLRQVSTAVARRAFGGDRSNLAQVGDHLGKGGPSGIARGEAPQVLAVASTRSADRSGWPPWAGGRPRPLAVHRRDRRSHQRQLHRPAAAPDLPAMAAQDAAAPRRQVAPRPGGRWPPRYGVQSSARRPQP